MDCVFPWGMCVPSGAMHFETCATCVDLFLHVVCRIWDTAIHVAKDFSHVQNMSVHVQNMLLHVQQNLLMCTLMCTLCFKIWKMCFTCVTHIASCADLCATQVVTHVATCATFGGTHVMCATTLEMLCKPQHVQCVLWCGSCTCCNFKVLNYFIRVPGTAKHAAQQGRCGVAQGLKGRFIWQLHCQVLPWVF